MARRVGLSPHCTTEGPHGMHWAPCAVWGEGSFLLEDLCTGTPKAYVVRHGKRSEVTDVEFVPSIGLYRFKYAGPVPLEDYAEPHQMQVSVA